MAKTVSTATGQDDPDRMEVINTVQGRWRSRQSDERDKAMRKVRKTNNTVTESEQLDELSQETLSNYQKKNYENPSSDPRVARNRKAGLHRSAARRHQYLTTTEMKPKNKKEAIANFNRTMRMHNAGNKAMREENEVSEHLDTMIDAVINKTPGEFAAAMGAELNNRIMDAIDARREVVAQAMFAPESEED